MSTVVQPLDITKDSPTEPTLCGAVVYPPTPLCFCRRLRFPQCWQKVELLLLPTLGHF